MPLPRASSAIVRRRLPAGCASVIRTTPSPHATNAPDSSTASTVPGSAPSDADGANAATRAPNTFTSAPASVVNAPGFGAKARIDRATSLADRVQSSRASSRSIFGANVASELSCGRSTSLPIASRASASISARAPSSERRSCSSPYVSSSGMGVGTCQRIGPASSFGTMRMIVTPVSDCPARTAAWIGAAPRHCGSSEAWMLSVPRSGRSMTSRGRMWPYATTTDRSTSSARISSRNASPRGRSGWRTGSDSSRAIRLMGDATSDERERPRGRSGCVTTPATSNPSPMSARRGGAANSGVPQKRIRIVWSERLFAVPTGDCVRRKLSNVQREVLLHRLPLRERRAPLEKAEVVEEQLAVQVIDLVLQAASEEIGGLEFERLAIAIERSHRNARRAIDVAEHFRDREATFLAPGGALADDDLWVHDDDRAVVEVDHGEPLRPTHLWCREPDALRRVHRLEHVVGQAAQLVGHALDGLGLLPKNRRAQDVDFEEGHYLSRKCELVAGCLCWSLGDAGRPGAAT